MYKPSSLTAILLFQFKRDKTTTLLLHFCKMPGVGVI
uniref:Uncharacterized protein n=1 Tax=Anguilla anguilla TaxID=7936 RepID=A0A0E9VFT9_ANGAN